MYIRSTLALCSLIALLSVDAQAYTRARVATPDTKISITDTARAGDDEATPETVETPVVEPITAEEIQDISIVNSETTANNVAYILNCQDKYKNLILAHCDDNPKTCSASSTVEILMHVEANMIDAQCKSIPLTSKTMSVEEALALYKRCEKMGGGYDVDAKRCAFNVELRKGKNKQEVIGSAVVLESDTHTCGKELFPEAAKKRNQNIALTGVLSAAGGAVAGGFISQELFKKSSLEKEIQKYCGVNNKDTLKQISKSAMEQKKLTIDILSANGVKDPQECLNRLIFATARTPLEQLENTFYVFSKHDPLYFDWDDSQIISEQGDKLNALASLLVSNPDMKIILIGYADKSGAAGYNTTLSEARAKAVKNELQKIAPEIKDEQIKVTGAGESADYPQDDNAREQHNRRVDIVMNYNSELSAKAMKGDFKKGAIIGGVSGAVVGTGLGALISHERYNCYLEGRDEIIAGWNDEFSLPKK